jgi:hypothetical protein
MFSPRWIAGSALIVLLYSALGLTNVMLRAPWCDEAWFGNPAYNLAYKGFMGTTVLDPASSTWKNVRLTGIDRHTYWVMPLNLLANAAAFRIFGFSVFSMRLLSLLWGLCALAAWGVIVWKLTGDESLVLLSLGLIAIDYHFLLQASDGRMDAMALGLGWCGVAIYLHCRERNFTLAVAASQTLAAMSFFTHPNGLMLVLILLAATLYFDRRRIRATTLAIAAVPYLAIGAGWALYIAQSPADFIDQFLGNASGRGPTITTPLAALKLEIALRYCNAYGLASWSSLSGRLNAIPLLLFLAGLVVCLMAPGIRTHPGYRLLLIWTGIVAFYLAEFEGLKTHFYLIYLTPLLSILLAAALLWTWRNLPRWRIVVTAVAVCLVLLQVSRTPIADLRNPRRSTYQPAVEYLRSNFQPETFIMGGAGLLFGLGPDWHILDDVRLGYNSGKRADVVVIDPNWADNIEVMKSTRPSLFAFVTNLLQSEYREVYNHRGYRILVREPRAYAQPASPLL